MVTILKGKNMGLIEDLTALKNSAVERINDKNADIEQLRVKLLGKKGELTGLLKEIGRAHV